MDYLATIFDATLYAVEGEDPSKAIINQEKRGQQDVVRRHHLPILVNHGIPDGVRSKGIPREADYRERVHIANKNKEEWTRQQYERMGIKIIDKFDDLLYSVELPEGWEIRASDNSMWNYLIDNKGRKRAAFFYKAAFCDRDAFINFCHRYHFDVLPFDEYKSKATYEERKFKPWKLHLTDGGVSIKVLTEATPTTDDEYYKVDVTLAKIGRAYLNENYPGWEDINSYWD